MSHSEVFRLCHPCEERMNEVSFRPLEWYRLALRHGPYLYPLSEEFYSDGGISLSASQEMEEEPDLLRAPVLADVRDDIEKLWKHTLTRRHLKPKLLAAWRSHPKAVAGAFLERMWQTCKDEHSRRRMLELCAQCLGRAGSDVVRRAWANYARAKPKMRKVRRQPPFKPDREALEFHDIIDRMLNERAAAKKNPEDDDWLSVGRRAVAWKKNKLPAETDDSGEGDVDAELMSFIPETDSAGISLRELAHASAACLPAAEGFERVREVLESMPEGGRHDHLVLLASFGSTRTLDWIEANVERPVTEEWGQVAAVSGLDWARVVPGWKEGGP